MYTIVNLSAAIIQVSIYERITTAMCSGANENINEVKLDKKLSPINVWAIAFGCIIGSGAFLLPGTSFLPKAGPLGAAAAMLTGAFAMVIIAINYNYPFEISPPSERRYRVLLKPRKSLKIRQFIHVKAL